MISLHWNYKDLFRACRLGFSAKKIWMQMLGLFVGGLGYTLLTYVAYAAAGAPVSAVWERFSLFPFLDPHLASPGIAVDIPWWSWLIWSGGLAWFLAVAMVTGTAVSRIAYEQLRGDDFFEIRAAFKYALERIGTIVATPMMPLLFAVFLALCGLILSLIGAIPVVGEILVAVLALPAFGASLFIVYLLVVLVFSLVLTPPIVGATRNDAFDSLFEVFSSTNEQTWRLVVYTGLLAGLAIFGGAVLGWFSMQAVNLGSSILQGFMGEKLLNVMSGGSFYLRLSLPSWCPLNGLCGYDGLLFGGDDLAAVGVSQNIAALFVGVSAYILLMFVVGYSLSVWNTGTVLMFCVLLKKKDDKDLLSEKDTDDLLSEEPLTEKMQGKSESARNTQPEGPAATAGAADSA